MRDGPVALIQTLGRIFLLTATVTVGTVLGMIASAIYWLNVLAPTHIKHSEPGWVPCLIAIVFPTLCVLAVNHRTRVSVKEAVLCALTGGVLGNWLTPQTSGTTTDDLVMSLQQLEFWRFPPCGSAVCAGVLLFGYFACKIFQKDRPPTTTDEPARLTHDSSL